LLHHRRDVVSLCDVGGIRHKRRRLGGKTHTPALTGGGFGDRLPGGFGSGHPPLSRKLIKRALRVVSEPE